MLTTACAAASAKFCTRANSCWRRLSCGSGRDDRVVMATFPVPSPTLTTWTEPRSSGRSEREVERAVREQVDAAGAGIAAQRARQQQRFAHIRGRAGRLGGG